MVLMIRKNYQLFYDKSPLTSNVPRGTLQERDHFLHNSINLKRTRANVNLNMT